MLACLILSDALEYSWRGGGPVDEVVFSVEFEQITGLEMISYVYLSQRTMISAKNDKSKCFLLIGEVSVAQNQGRHPGKVPLVLVHSKFCGVQNGATWPLMEASGQW